MKMRPADELLYDSEATLRLVDDALDELRAPDEAETTARMQQVPELPSLLRQAHAEVSAALAELQAGPSSGDAPASAEVAPQPGRADDCTVAALERALALVDGLDVESSAVSAGRASDLRAALRQELLRLVDSLKPTPANDDSGDVLTGIERRLTSLERLLSLPAQFEEDSTARRTG